MEDIFTKIYDKNAWLIGSEFGSTPDYNQQYIPFFQKFLWDRGIENGRSK